MKNNKYSLFLVPLVFALVAAMAKSRSSSWMPLEKKREPLESLFSQPDYASRLSSSLSDQDKAKAYHWLMKVGGISLFMLMRHRLMKMYAHKEGRMESAMRFYGKKADEAFRKLEKDYLG